MVWLGACDVIQDSCQDIGASILKTWRKPRPNFSRGRVNSYWEWQVLTTNPLETTKEKPYVVGIQPSPPDYVHPRFCQVHALTIMLVIQIPICLTCYYSVFTPTQTSLSWAFSLRCQHERWNPLISRFAKSVLKINWEILPFLRALQIETSIANKRRYSHLFELCPNG